MLQAVLNSSSRQPVEIAPAKEDDLQSIGQLAGVIWHEYYPGIISHEQIEYMLAQMYSLETLRAELKDGTYYECLYGSGKMAGFAAFGPTESADAFKLHKLYLLSSHHGCGLGSLLLNHCEAKIRALRARELTLNVNKRNAKAIACYRRNGFRITDSVVVDIGNGFVMDDYVMAKSLV